MNKNEYLYILRKNIQSLQSDEIDEIIDDVASHFDFGLAEGKTEEDVAKELGDPELMARQFIPNPRPKQQSEPIIIPSTFGRVVKFLVYGFIALIALPSIFGIYAALISMIVAGIALVFTAIALLFSPILVAIIPGLISNPLTVGGTIIAALGVLLIGIALIWIFVVLTKLFTQLITFVYKRMFGAGGSL